MIDEKRKFSIQKGNVIIPVVLILGVFIGGVVVLQTKGIGASLISEGKKIFIPVADEPDADPDSDGLKNWEETTYKTDPRKFDTDDDGYSDGEEVLSGYNPIKPAPNDALEGTDTTTPRPTPKNLTEYLSQLIIDKVATGEFKPVSDADTAPDSALINNEEILSEALVHIAATAEREFVLSRINDSEIKISTKDTKKEEVFAYIASISAVLEDEKVITDIGLSEAEIIEKTVATKDKKNIEKLIDFYQVGIDKIRKITTPKDFADIHKEQLAIFELTKKILIAIKNFEEDPATAAAAAEKYPDMKNILENFTKKLVERMGRYNE
ncbi:MAG: hypothetical protein AAB614_00960 [Patescibacteria group bacterium]